MLAHESNMRNIAEDLEAEQLLTSLDLQNLLLLQYQTSIARVGGEWVTTAGTIDDVPWRSKEHYNATKESGAALSIRPYIATRKAAYLAPTPYELGFASEANPDAYRAIIHELGITEFRTPSQHWHTQRPKRPTSMSEVLSDFKCYLAHNKIINTDLGIPGYIGYSSVGPKNSASLFNNFAQKVGSIANCIPWDDHKGIDDFLKRINSTAVV